MAPSTDAVTRGYVDHTWVVEKRDDRTTYFDCAGGHDAPDTTNNILQTTAALNAMVRISTLNTIDPNHPYKSSYGTNDVSGSETAGIVASGFRNWGGQCHQIANRIFYVGWPQRSIDDIAWAQRPSGYGLSCFLWGRYGVDFASWCRRLDYPAPPSEPDAVFDYIKRNVAIDAAVKVYYHIIDLRAATSADPQNPKGPAIKEFFHRVHDEGISNATLSKLTSLPENKVAEELLP